MKVAELLIHAFYWPFENWQFFINKKVGKVETWDKNKQTDSNSYNDLFSKYILRSKLIESFSTLLNRSWK